MAFSTGTMGRLGDGDNLEWRRLVWRMEPRLLRFFLRRSVGEQAARELAHEVFVRLEVKRHRPSTNDPYELRREQFVGWLCTVARNVLREWVRRRRPEEIPDELLCTRQHRDVLGELESALEQLRIEMCYLQTLAELELHPTLKPWAVEAYQLRKRGIPGPDVLDGCEAFSLDEVLARMLAMGHALERGELGRQVENVGRLLEHRMKVCLKGA